jgi:GMP synthase (glutamine-hydrolysing)
MKKSITILKMGSLYPDLEKRRGSFEDYILAGMRLLKEQALIPWVHRGDALPNYDVVSGIVVTGSLAMVSDRLDWSERAAAWLAGAVQRQIPVLGICYGHQLLAHALGGEAGNNLNGWDVGSADVHLTPTAIDDPLFGKLDSIFKQHFFHRQSALRLPPGAELLASNALEPHVAFRVGTCAWGVQFHPEFDAEIQKFNIHQESEMLHKNGMDPAALLATVEECPTGPYILSRFYEICDNHASSSI